MSGTYQTNRDGQAITYALFRTCVKKVGLAISQPTLPPTAEERRAIDEIRRRYSEPLSDARLAELKAMGKQE